MNGRNRRLGALLLLLAATGATAQTAPGGSEARVQVVSYVPDQVVTLRVGIGYALVVELSPDERVDSVVVGNSAVWQATANKRGDRLVIKPSSTAGATDMIVTTDARRYVFALQPAADDSAPFVVRFAFPETAPVAAVPEQPAARFKLSGAKELFPIEMTDDGHRTRIRWAVDTPLPAVLAVEDRGHEAIVNGRMVDGVYVIERVAKRFLFTRAKARATADRRPIKAPAS